jgi:hypothetical protein
MGQIVICFSLYPHLFFFEKAREAERKTWVKLSNCHGKKVAAL